jgi:PAS domain S-box-containing protein
MQGEPRTKEQVISELSAMLERLVEGNDSEDEPPSEGNSSGGPERRGEVLADLSFEALRGWYVSHLFEAAVRLAAQHLGVELCGIFKMEKSGERLRLAAGYGWEAEEMGSASVSARAGLHAGYTLRAGKPVVVRDLASDERFADSGLLAGRRGVVSGLSVPMVAGKFVFGVMGAYTSRPRDFSQEDADFLQTVANILTISALRRQALAALRQTYRGLLETKRYLKSIIETSADAIISTDLRGNMVLCNKGTEAMLGYKREEVVGRPVTMLFESEHEAEKIMGLMREGGGTLEGAETTLLAKGGHRIPALTYASIFYDEKGRERGSVRFNRDLRDRKRWEEELDKVGEEIEKTQNALEQAQAEADAAGDLRRANEELLRLIEFNKKTQAKLVKAEKMAALGRLTAGISHEIMNPLNIISLNLHVLLQNPDVPEDLLKTLKILRMQAERIASITDALIDYASRREPEPRDLDLNALVERTLSLLSFELMNGDITVVQGFARGLPPVWADHDQIQQVLLNLLSNARDAMTGGGQLFLSTRVVLSNGRKFAELQVGDTGEGIAPEHMGKLFDPFFTTKPEGEGAGLGLSICHGIILAHGGSIRAENREGRGTTFTVELPLEKT